MDSSPSPGSYFLKCVEATGPGGSLGRERPQRVRAKRARGAHFGVFRGYESATRATGSRQGERPGRRVGARSWVALGRAGPGRAAGGRTWSVAGRVGSTRAVRGRTWSSAGRIGRWAAGLVKKSGPGSVVCGPGTGCARPDSVDGGPGHRLGWAWLWTLALVGPGGGAEAKRCQRHAVFPSGHPSKYYPHPTLLNFGVRKGTGGSSVVWSLARARAARGALVPSGRRSTHARH